MSDDLVGFHPYVRQGKIAIVGKAKRVSQSYKLNALTGLPWSVRERCWFILECPFGWDKDAGVALEQLFDTEEVRCWWQRCAGIEKLIAHTKKIEMRVLKARDPALLRPWVSPNPYTDDDCVLMGFDDIVALMLSC